MGLFGSGFSARDLGEILDKIEDASIAIRGLREDLSKAGDPFTANEILVGSLRRALELEDAPGVPFFNLVEFLREAEYLLEDLSRCQSMNEIVSFTTGNLGRIKEQGSVLMQVMDAWRDNVARGVK